MTSYRHKMLSSYVYVTEFAKNNLMGINAEIPFLPVEELSRDTKHLGIDGQVCFFRRLFSDAAN